MEGCLLLGNLRQECEAKIQLDSFQIKYLSTVIFVIAKTSLKIFYCKVKHIGFVMMEYNKHFTL